MKCFSFVVSEDRDRETNQKRKGDNSKNEHSFNGFAPPPAFGRASLQTNRVKDDLIL